MAIHKFHRYAGLMYPNYGDGRKSHTPLQVFSPLRYCIFNIPFYCAAAV